MHSFPMAAGISTSHSLKVLAYSSVVLKREAGLLGSNRGVGHAAFLLEALRGSLFLGPFQLLEAAHTL